MSLTITHARFAYGTLHFVTQWSNHEHPAIAAIGEHVTYHDAVLEPGTYQDVVIELGNYLRTFSPISDLNRFSVRLIRCFISWGKYCLAYRKTHLLMIRLCKLVFFSVLCIYMPFFWHVSSQRRTITFRRDVQIAVFHSLPVLAFIAENAEWWYSWIYSALEQKNPLAAACQSFAASV